MAKTKRIGSLLRWYGGKARLAKQIIPLFPQHKTYVEPFGGAASVLLQKTPSPIEVYNDLNERLTRLFRVVRDHPDELQRRLMLTPYSEIEFQRCQVGVEHIEDEIELARRDFVGWRMSFSGVGTKCGFSWTLGRARRGIADVVSGYLSAIEETLPRVADRFRVVQIMNRPAVEIVKRFDADDVLVYCDPPYTHGSRSAGSVSAYDHEMSDDDHAQLLATLKACRGAVVLSGYANDLYDDELSSWCRLAVEVSSSATKQTRPKRTEVLWLNYEPADYEAHGWTRT